MFYVSRSLTPPKYKNKLYEYEQLGFIKIIENEWDRDWETNLALYLTS